MTARTFARKHLPNSYSVKTPFVIKNPINFILTTKGDEISSTARFKTTAKINSSSKAERISLIILKFLVQITDQCRILE